MARDYYFDYGWRLADDPDDPGFGAGGREVFRYGDEWVTDEMIETRAEWLKRSYISDATRIRDKEMELDRKAAEPFWRRWLGA